MNESRKISINNFYKARITEKYRPLFAKHSEFIRTSKYYLYFERFGDKYREVFTNREISDVINNLNEAKVGVTSVVAPEPVKKNVFNRIQIDQGYVTLYDVVKIFKNQKAVKRDNEKGKAKVKKIGTLI